MSAKKIDPVTGDLARDSGFIRVSGEEEIRQGVDARLQRLQGEDPWNTTTGTRWLGYIFKKGTPVGLILNELTRRILTQPGMLTVDSIDATDVGGTGSRAIRVDWTGTASVATLAELLRVGGSTVVAA